MKEREWGHSQSWGWHQGGLTRHNPEVRAAPCTLVCAADSLRAAVTIQQPTVIRVHQLHPFPPVSEPHPPLFNFLCPHITAWCARVWVCCTVGAGGGGYAGCGTELCLRCLTPAHPGYTCEQYQVIGEGGRGGGQLWQGLSCTQGTLPGPSGQPPGEYLDDAHRSRHLSADGWLLVKGKAGNGSQHWRPTRLLRRPVCCLLRLRLVSQLYLFAARCCRQLRCWPLPLTSPTSPFPTPPHHHFTPPHPLHTAILCTHNHPFPPSRPCRRRCA